MDEDQETGTPRPNATIQIDALDADEIYPATSSEPPSLPPPLPPRSSAAPSQAPLATSSTPEPESRKRLWIAAALIGALMAGLGLLAGQLLAPEPEPVADPPSSMEIGPIEIE